MLYRDSVSLSAQGGRSRILSPCQTHIPNPTAGQYELQTCILPSSTCILGLKFAFSLDSPSGSALLGFLLALRVLESAAGQNWEGPCPRSRIVTQLLPALPRSTAALSYKILCCSKRWEKNHEPCMQAAALRVMTAGLCICTGITLNYYLH